jgi:hypothetical protein
MLRAWAAALRVPAAPDRSLLKNKNPGFSAGGVGANLLKRFSISETKRRRLTPLRYL